METLWQGLHPGRGHSNARQSMLRSFFRVLGADPGFDARGVLTAS